MPSYDERTEIYGRCMFCAKPVEDPWIALSECDSCGRGLRAYVIPIPYSEWFPKYDALNAGRLMNSNTLEVM